MESDKTMFWSMMGLLSLQSNTLPGYLRQLYKLWMSYRDNLGAYSNIDIPEFEESSMGTNNEIYASVGAYLSSLDATANAPRVSIARSRSNAQLSFTLPHGHTVEDEFEGAHIWWRHNVNTEEKNGSRETGNRTDIWWRHKVKIEEKTGSRDMGSRTDRKYVLKTANKDRGRILEAYIEHISNFAAELKRRSKDRKLYSNIDGRNMDVRSKWSSVSFKHPSTFATVALDPELKDKVKRDLDCFKQSRDFYRRIGRAWKRGYLLYGPPGTGKSSLIAAIANYMHYDVYDLELTKVFDNSSLRELLLGTANKSVIVIEDIDCAANLPEKVLCRPPNPEKSGRPTDGARPRKQMVTLSGLLNFADGLWSSCGEERIMIFTTNHRDRLDPALLRCGRMDMHILLSHCGFPAFKQLVYNYLDIKDHLLFPIVEEKMQAGGCLTPADICEILIQNKDDHDSAIKSVIAALELSIAIPLLDAQLSSESEKDSSVAKEEEGSSLSLTTSEEDSSSDDS